MAEPLKYLLNDTVPPRIAAMVRRAWRKFDTTAFLQQVQPGYESLELMARGQRIAHALQAHLPQDVPRALGVLVDSMDPSMGIDAAGEPDAGDRPYSAFLYLPHSIYIGTHGLPHFEAAMAAQHALTQRFTAEFSIRPYLLHHQGATLARLRDWAQDDNAHVRRLVSEGTRPRLPWAPRLPAFQNNPQLALPLLDALKDDPSSYVRRSVANHLGDIAKDHPELAVGPRAPGCRARPPRARLWCATACVFSSNAATLARSMPWAWVTPWRWTCGPRACCPPAHASATRCASRSNCTTPRRSRSACWPT
ncbi:hypothetical protein [Acidovorax sp. FHTAMBA]|jgi:3-methyladenine DNA glycosylase AlkC|uniref:hypothetical protein n=1 Tax=Acidovorax sp. FHTAMBA TaxID=3140252 RepID=UPI001FE57280